MFFFTKHRVKSLCAFCVATSFLTSVGCLANTETDPKVECSVDSSSPEHTAKCKGKHDKRSERALLKKIESVVKEVERVNQPRDPIASGTNGTAGSDI